MRDIKFRGKRLDTDEWIYGALVKELDGWSICDWSSIGYSRYDVDPDTVGEFTGLLDKYGTEIYEDDLVARKNTYGGKYALVKKVEWIKSYSYAGWNIGIGKKQDWEVTGNVYSNKEMVR